LEAITMLHITEQEGAMSVAFLAAFGALYLLDRICAHLQAIRSALETIAARERP
jgi:hypothetical protein